jgi:EmrB/QacA subfamily drug resistance transporter
MSTIPDQTRTQSETLDPRRWAALAVLLVGAFLAPLDFFIVNVAMPAIRDGLDATPADIQLVISGYAIVYAALLITGGRLGDIFGRKAVFLAGLAGFALASALCGLAWSPTSLILGRLVQALAAAAMAPQALASVHALFPARERGLALSIYGVTLGLSSIAGQLLGGVLVAANLGGFGWRLIFLVNLPVALAAFIAALPLLRETRGGKRPKLDIIGVLLSAATLTALVLPLIEGRESGWPLWTIVLLLSTPIFAEAFRRYETALAKRGGEPLVTMDIFQTPGLARGLAAIGTLYALAAFFLTFSIYLQAGLGFSPLASGLAILPFSVGFLAGSTTSPRTGRALGRHATSAGYVTSAIGLLMLASTVYLTPAHVTPTFAPFAMALLIMGLGLGTSIPTMARVVVERVEPSRAGLVGGLVNSMLQVSAAIGVALLGGLFFTVLGHQTDARSISVAFAITLIGVAIAHLIGGAMALGLGQPRPSAIATRIETAEVASCNR